MSNPKIVCVVPTIRPECHRQFKDAWWSLFVRHRVTLITVWDGESPHVTEQRWDDEIPHPAHVPFDADCEAELFCRFTDGIRNLGFVAAAAMGADFVLTLDDDVRAITEEDGYWLTDYMTVDEVTAKFDPIQAHLDALARRVPISWMNTAHMGAPYLRGFPYGVRDEAPVMLSHGVWVGTPDFDGETQLRLEQAGGVPKTLPYYVGPVPKGVLIPICGMSLMVRKDALPYLYFTPMGPDSGFPDLHRFADIWMGTVLKRKFDELGWAVYTGASTVLHSRASDAKVNEERERLGREWNEWLSSSSTTPPPEMWKYAESWLGKRLRFADLIRSLQGGK